MNRALVYARRSTSEHQAASLDVQTEEARRFCAARGWEVVDVIAESDVSRAEFVNRPGLQRLLAGAVATPRAFDVVVMRDESRLGGDMYRTGMALQELHDARVEVWYYAAGERVSFDDPTSKLMAAVRLYASELERMKIAGRTREALAHRHREGLNVGGRCYGYDNVRVVDPSGRARTEYKINPAQAAVVREVFELHAGGAGVRGIASLLNTRGVPAPHAGRRGTGTWSSSCVHAMLRRERYKGLLRWGEVGAEYRGGTRVALRRPEAVVEVERPELAIVDADLWARAQERTTLDPIGGDARRFGAAPGYLLTGLGRCAVCGGPIQAGNGKAGRERIKVYTCGWHRSRGSAVCPVSTRRPVDLIDDAVLGWIRQHVLSPAVVDRMVAGARRLLEADDAPPTFEADEVRGQLARVEREVARLAAALAESDEPPAAILGAIREREARAASLRARLDILSQVQAPVARPRWADVERELRGRVEELQPLFGRDVRAARVALGKLLRGPLQFETVRNQKPAWKITGEVALPGGFLSVCDPNGLWTDPVFATG